ncbi:hypothetical protein J4558_03230 [Leptolyngbya sp. 15MV]|nr:hypothetical protein J4558_03230 [Leptolyngbya sp. 15MV]
MDDLASFLADAQALLGPRGWTRDADLLEPWLTDWRGRYTGRALGLASPGSTAEVAGFVRLCARHAVAIVPQGGNSGMLRMVLGGLACILHGLLPFLFVKTGSRQIETLHGRMVVSRSKLPAPLDFVI